MINKSLRELVLKHNNNYGFDVCDITSSDTKINKNLSVIIPYFETGLLLRKTLFHLYNSINNIAKLNKKWKFEVLVIDDKSTTNPAAVVIGRLKFKNLKIIVNSKNSGSAHSRNVGLRNAKYDVCLFMDADVLIDDNLIKSHLKIHSYLDGDRKKKAVTISFFEFGDEKHHLLNFRKIRPSYLKLNDFRLHCVYQRTWIGCDEDKVFIDQEFSLVNSTEEFKKWKGVYKAWVLPTMVLGGFFMVDRVESLEVGGINESFSGYGFTEIPLATKLVAIKKHFIIPVLNGGALHIDIKNPNLTRQDKDKLFRKKHELYFNKFLNLNTQNAIEDKD